MKKKLPVISLKPNRKVLIERNEGAIGNFIRGSFSEPCCLIFLLFVEVVFVIVFKPFLLDLIEFGSKLAICVHLKVNMLSLVFDGTHIEIGFLLLADLVRI